MNKVLWCVLVALLVCPVHTWAAFPIVQATNSNSDAVATTTHTVNLPSGLASGHLLLVFFSCRNSTATITTPSGWTQVTADFNSGGSASGQTISAIYRRTSDGSEGSTLSVTTSASNACASISKRITGHHASTDPEAAGTAATGNSSNPNPPSLSPSWGAEDTLWIAMEANVADRAVSVWPTDFNDNQLRVASSTGTNVTLAYSERSVNASSQDPSAMTIAAPENWGSQTVAVRPAAVASDFGGEPIWYP